MDGEMPYPEWPDADVVFVVHPPPLDIPVLAEVWQRSGMKGPTRGRVGRWLAYHAGYYYDTMAYQRITVAFSPIHGEPVAGTAMPSVQNLREKLDYLVQVTGRAEADIVAQAIECGLTDLYRRQVAEAYLAGDVERPQALAALGQEAVEDLDYARRAVEDDVQWGLHGA